jgi:hypothetical protein
MATFSKQLISLQEKHEKVIIKASSQQSSEVTFKEILQLIERLYQQIDMY